MRVAKAGIAVWFWEDGRDEHCDTVAAKETEEQGESKREEKKKDKGRGGIK